MLVRFVYFIFFLATSINLHAQLQNANSPFADSLKQSLAKATSAEEKVKYLGKLSRLYMTTDKALSDDYSNQLAQIAEASRDRKLMIQALHHNAQRYLNFSSLQDNITTGIAYSQKALDLAKASHLDEYEAWSYLLLARGARANGETDKALTYNNLAVSLAAQWIMIH